MRLKFCGQLSKALIRVLFSEIFLTFIPMKASPIKAALHCGNSRSGLVHFKEQKRNKKTFFAFLTALAQGLFTRESDFTLG
jgi:hypothetical protein